LIFLWLTDIHIQGDTLENVSKELESIMNTGHFELIIAPKRIMQMEQGDAESSSKVLLYYEPIGELYDLKHRAKTISLCQSFEGNVPFSPPTVDKQVSCSQEVWSKKQIDEFVRKLGFLETQKAEEESIKLFQQLNQVRTLNLCILHALY